MITQKFIVVPLIGINEIHLNAGKSDVRKLLGECDSKRFNEDEFGYQDIEYYFNSVLSIHYNKEARTEYLEISGYGSNTTSTELYGIDVFATRADELIDQIKSKANTNFYGQDNELPESYVFLDLKLSLWRKSMPYGSLDTQLFDEFGNGHFFLTIGLGVTNYYTEALLRGEI